jgi:hypothetical protein
MPQTVKNLDKAVGKILLAAGENAEARIKANTGKQKAAGRLAIDGMYRTAEDKRKLENRAATIKVAVDEMNQNSSEADARGDIDDDWLNYYAKLAEDKSSEELQILFGKILAGEVRNPGTYSLRTLQFVATLSRNDAQSIADFFAFTLDRHALPHLKDDNQTNEPSFNSRLLMEELGIATSASRLGGLILRCTIRATSPRVFISWGRAIIVYNRSGEEFEIALPCQFLTNPGKELISIANPPRPSTKYLEDVADVIFELIQRERPNDVKGEKITVAVVEIAEETANQIKTGRTLYTASPKSS